MEDLPLDLSEDFDIILDAMFGFSYHGKYYLSSFSTTYVSVYSLRFYKEITQKLKLPFGKYIKNSYSEIETKCIPLRRLKKSLLDNFFFHLVHMHALDWIKLFSVRNLFLLTILVYLTRGPNPILCFI